MYLEDFKSGSYEKHGEYSSFLPASINHSWQWQDSKIDMLLEKANMEIGKLNSYSELIPNIDLYIKLHIRVEANKSSRIEGTQTSIEEEMMDLEDLNPDRRDDVREVQNYIDAIQYGVNRITQDGFPLSSRLIREIHGELMKGVRGEHKTPGEYRKSQNWIGGSMPSNAVYVPPSHERVAELISDMEKFIHNEDIFVPQLLKTAIVHYQFETIHPFLDGNGRTGRILIPLMFLNQEILQKPCFYISNYFEMRRTEYYHALHNVRIKDDMSGWIIFFLEASIQTAYEARIKFGNAVKYVEECKKQIGKISGYPQNVMEILSAFFENPLQMGNQLSKNLNMSKQTVHRTLKSMEELGMITEITGYTRNQIFLMQNYVDIFKS